MAASIHRYGTGRMAGDYQALWVALNRGERVVLTAQRHLELLHPHNPPADPRWPTPGGIPGAMDLLGRLPQRPALACLLVAGEAAVALWETWAIPRRKEWGPIIEAPRRALGALEAWAMRGDAEEPCKLPLLTCRAFGMGDPGYQLTHTRLAAAALAVHHLGQAAFDPERFAYSALMVLQFTLEALTPDGVYRDAFDAPTFWDWWWRRSRCRLALADLRDPSFGMPA